MPRSRPRSFDVQAVDTIVERIEKANGRASALIAGHHRIGPVPEARDESRRSRPKPPPSYSPACRNRHDQTEEQTMTIKG